jgi:hypothetical protein
LDQDKTNGLKLEWSNIEAVDKLLDMAAQRERENWAPLEMNRPNSWA